MRSIVAALAVVWLNCAAMAQPSSTLPSDALITFADVCIDTSANADAAASKLSDYGWSAATPESIPATRRSRRGVSVQIEGERPANSRVFSIETPGGVLFVELYIRTRFDGRGRKRREQSYPACDLYAAGVSEQEVADTLFANDDARRDGFVAAPLAFVTRNGRQFVVGVSRISVRDPLARLQSLAFFSVEGPALAQ